MKMKLLKVELIVFFLPIAYIIFFICIESPFYINALIKEFGQNSVLLCATLFCLFLLLSIFSLKYLYELILDKEKAFKVSRVFFACLIPLLFILIINIFFEVVDYIIASLFLLINPSICILHLGYLASKANLDTFN